MNSISDRHCIDNVKRGNPTQRSFSYQDPLECCSRGTCGTGPNQGCNGGYIHGGFAFAQTVGVVSGENYQNSTTCKPYFFKPGASGSNAKAPSCTATCANTAVYTNPYSEDRLKISKFGAITGPIIPLIVLQAMQMIITKGSVIAGMDVYSDFYYYSKGVYQKNSGTFIGGHAVRVVGWGITSAGIAYWIVANSWGTNWGMNGFFWMIRGANNCRFETFMTYGEI
jgi:cathepsin B